MPLVTVSNRTSSKFAVPPPIARVLGPGKSVTVSLSTLDGLDALSASVNSGLISVTVANNTSVPDQLEAALVGAVAATVRDVTLAAAAEAGNARVVTGQLVDGNGAAVEVVSDVFIEVMAPTAGQGAITVTAGTQQVNVAPGATNFSRAWVKTTAAGAFAFSVADTAVESCLVKVTADGGACTLMTLAFAA